MDTPRVVITGASSGIGRATALAFARETHARLLLAARSVEPLASAAAECLSAGAAEARYQTCDVTSADDVATLARTASDLWTGEADVVLANAGVGQFGDFLDTDMRDVARVLDTNVLGVMRTAHAFGTMLSRARGQLIVVGSQAGRVPTPRSSVYAASKWALTGWTRSARPEMEARGIALTLISPGGVETEFKENRILASGVGAEGREKVPGSQSVEHVASVIVRAARKRPAEVDLSLVGAVGRAAHAVAPEAFARAMFRARRKR